MTPPTTLTKERDMHEQRTDVTAEAPPVATGQIVLDPIEHMMAYKIVSIARDTVRYFGGGTQLGWNVIATSIRTGETERWTVGPDYQWTPVEVDDSGRWRPIDRQQPADRALSVGEVAKFFRVNPKTVVRWAASGALVESFRTPGGHRRYLESAVLAAAQAAVVRPSGDVR